MIRPFLKNTLTEVVIQEKLARPEEIRLIVTAVNVRTDGRSGLTNREYEESRLITSLPAEVFR